MAKDRIGQQNAVRVVSSLSGGYSYISQNVIGGISSVASLSVSGLSTFVGLSTFKNDVFIDGKLSVKGTGLFGGSVKIDSTAESTSKDTGSLVLEGGLGVEKNTNIGGNLGVTGTGTFNGSLKVNNTTESTNKDTGSLVLEGGLGVEKNTNIGGNLDVTGTGRINSTIESTNKDTGSLVLEGGLGVEKNTNIGGNLNVTGTGTFNGSLKVNNTTESTNKDTGSLVLDGGLGVEKNINIGGNAGISGNLYVGGYSEFVGVVTFRGGVINIGDQDSDDINIGGEFISDLRPNVDNQYSVGIPSKRWSNLNAVNVNTTNISVTGFSTFSEFAIFNSDIEVAGRSVLNDELYVDGNSYFNETLTSLSQISGVNLFLSGIATVFGGLYYVPSYSGGVAYFDNSGLMVSTAGTDFTVDYTNYVLTTNNEGIPTWANVIDGGEY